MRATKAYIAGLGTTGVLLASAILLFVVMSAMVGFDAWPGGGRVERVERLVVAPQEEPIPVTADAPVAAAAPAAAGAPGAGPGEPGGPDGTPPVLGDQERGGDAPQPGAPAPGGSAPAAPVDPGVTLGIDPADPETARTVVADTAKGVTADLGGVVSVVSPDLGAAVAGTGERLSKELRSLPLPLTSGG